MIVVTFVRGGCHHLGVVDGYIVSVERFNFCRCDETFICILPIQMDKVYIIKDNKLNQ